MVTDLLLSVFLLDCWLVLLSGPGSLCEHLCIGTTTVTNEVA